MSFYTDVLKRDPRFNSTEVIKDVALLEPGTRKAVASFLERAKSQGHDIRIAETYRSQARQRQLYERKLTQLQNVGCHGYGVAVDLQLFSPRRADGKSVYDPIGEHYGFFQSLAVSVGMISGIGWGTPNAKHTFTDWDHIQRVPVFRQNAMFAGTWFPPEVYDPYQDMRDQHIVGMASSGPALQVHAPISQSVTGPVSVQFVQLALNKLGAQPVLEADGVMGPKTLAALYAWQVKAGLPANGTLSPATVAALERALKASEQ